jgi:hypothetical protein
MTPIHIQQPETVNTYRKSCIDLTMALHGAPKADSDDRPGPYGSVSALNSQQRKRNRGDDASLLASQQLDRSKGKTRGNHDDLIDSQRVVPLLQLDGLETVPLGDDKHEAFLFYSRTQSAPGSVFVPVKRTRKRRRVVLPLLTSGAILSAASDPYSAPGRDSGDHHPPPASTALEEDLPHYVQILLCILLTVSLALLAAWDAKEQCVRHETAYALSQLVDDEEHAFNNNNRKKEEEEDDGEVDMDDGGASLACRIMFERVLVPTTSATIGLAMLALIWIGGCASRRSAIGMTFELLILSFGIAAAQVYEIFTVMLRPRVWEGDEENTDDGINNYSNNPYQSLAAVDRYGHVGENANLFFLSWISVTLALALFYQLLTAFVRLYWRRGGDDFSDTASESQNSSAVLMAHSSLDPVTATAHHQHRRLLPAANWIEQEKSQLKRWYQTATLYRLRYRTGIWVATLVACLVIVFSSHHMWTVVIVPNAGDLRTTHVCAAQSNYHRNSYYNSARADSARILCQRTVAAWISGLVASALCATAIFMHLTSRRWTASYNQNLSTLEVHSLDEKVLNRLPLTTELILSILLSLLLGFNAVFSTGVQGPAATVGNLYFASWLAFFLCVRISLGCVEESHNLNDHDAPDDDQGSRHSELDPPPVDPVEKDRVKRLRSYFFLAIFSLVCGASAYDAASVIRWQQSLTKVQLYLMLAPCIVAAISGLLFVLCLSKRCYVIVSNFCVGGVLSMVCFGLWLGALVLTMHSEYSWAVNSVGEIVIANLYFYSWAGILSAGLLMMSYVRALFKIKHTDYMSIVWVAICKVCFVILGAALHVWHTIADNCDLDEITSGAVTFCSRTVLAIVVSLAGMLVGGLVVLGRILVMLCGGCGCIGPRTQAHVEMIVSMFLVLLFSATVALVTGIGGPGQSVGDLFFSTWLSFGVALGIFVQCEAQVRKDYTPLVQQQEQPSSYEPPLPEEAMRQSQIVLLAPMNGSVTV